MPTVIVVFCCINELNSNPISELLVLCVLCRLRLSKFDSRYFWSLSILLATGKNQAKTQNNQNRDVFVHFRLSLQGTV